jgi:uroporphyrinogen decarboxylase
MNDIFLRACRGEKTGYTPVWIMRQAGRYLPEYMELKKKADFLTLCKTPELCAEVTMQPVDRLGVDAAIFFSDILTTVEPMGMELHYEDGKGPSFGNPVKCRADVDRLVVPEPEEGLKFVIEAQKILAKELAGKVPLIGFAGSPFTVVAYMIEGHGVKVFAKTMRLLYDEPEMFRAMMDKVSQFTVKYLRAQIHAGSQAVMLFDSWAGLLCPWDYEAYNLPYVKRIIGELKDEGVPVIYFGLGAHGSLDKIKDCGADVIGVDMGLPLDYAISRLGSGVSVQGNLEPYTLLMPRPQMEARVRETLAMGKNARGHIFNLGHGIPRETTVSQAQDFVNAVHEFGGK